MTDRATAMWTARRALMEGCPATIERMATACQISAKSLLSRAHRENWALTGAASGMSRAERIKRVHDRLLDKLEKIQLHAMDGDKLLLDKASITELSTTAKVLAKISEGTDDQSSAQQDQMQRDEELAEILTRLDNKILELASFLAKDIALTKDMAFNPVDDAGIAACRS